MENNEELREALREMFEDSVEVAGLDMDLSMEGDDYTDILPQLLRHFFVEGFKQGQVVITAE